MFTGELVRAILDRTKTETRRLLAPSTVFVLDSETGKRAPRPEGFADLLIRSRVLPRFGGPALSLPAHPHRVIVPRVQAGDALWVRETWRPMERPDDATDGTEFRADGGFKSIENTQAAANTWLATHGGITAPSPGPWRPAVHLPRWACRLTLPIVEVRVERLHDIDDAGAAAEGVSGGAEAFGRLWRDLYGAESWAANPLALVYRWEPVGGER